MGRRPKAKDVYRDKKQESKLEKKEKRGRRGRLPKIEITESGETAEGKVIIGVSMGDPTGIGPEVTVKALLDKSIRKKIFPVIFGDKGVLAKLAEDIGLKVRFREISTLDNLKSIALGERELLVKSISNLKMTRLRYGRPDRNCGRAMVNYVKEAVKACLDGYVHAIVTAPINKEIINEAGFRYGGHTEMIAELTGAKEFTMMFVSKHFKVSLVTIHVPLKDVSMKITPQRIYKVGLLTWKTLRQYFGLKNPKIGVCGLNPHAGEGGIFGDEEKDMIYPAIVSMRSIGIDAEGPLSPDTAFWKAYNKQFDAIIAMYHDQGLIPVKLVDFDNAVNLTIGIPIIRTSPDHGTAYNIAGKGVADPSSMKAAIELAYQMYLTKKSLEEQKKEQAVEEKKKEEKVDQEIRRYRISEEELQEYIYL
jgi:4-hydroxythreonine-4-phosphate dehydrogenase